MASITIDIFAIIPLCFTIGLVRRRAVQNDRNIFYRAAALTTILLLLLEMMTFLVDRTRDPVFIVPNRLMNVLGFALSPLVPFFLLLFISHHRKINWALLLIPLCVNTLLCVSSYSTGWIFAVDAQNDYMRGPLFIVPFILSLVYYVLIVIDTCTNRSEFEKENKGFLFLVFSIPVVAAVLQILFPELLLIWASVSISLLLYYVFLLEMQFSYDIQTGILNRAAFEKEMQRRPNRNATIFIFDINDLKVINDRNGHIAGDNAIQDGVNIIKTCFLDVGKTYRIGGDEFCVVCTEISERSAEGMLSTFNERLAAVNQTLATKIEIACGYATCNVEKGETIEMAFSKADNAMYEQKAKLKQAHGGRAGGQ